jgi:glycosyltransferase involved in cell wall biosynthesis
LLARADQTVFISELTAAHFAGTHYRKPPELIFNGADTDTFFPPRGADEIRAARDQHGLPHGPRIALFVGRFVEKKGLPVLEHLARAQPHVLFAFAGWGQCDPRWWGLPNVRVFDDLHGAGLASLYRASDVLVLPSSGEGFPLVIQEALACGLPVVCGSETAKADPAAAPFLTATAVLPEDPAGTAARFGDALMHLLAAPGDDAIRQDRFELVRRRYSWSCAAERYADILAHLTKAERPRGLEGAGECAPVQDIR